MTCGHHQRPPEVNCGRCKHYTETLPVTKFGECAVNAWMKSYTPTKGWGMDPTAIFDRNCDKYEAAQ